MARKVAPPGQLRSDVSPSKVPGYSRRSAFPSPGRGCLSWRSLRCRVLLIASYRICRVDPIPPLPRRFRRTEVVFRRNRPPAPCESGFILSCASFASRVPSRVHLPVRVSAAGAFRGVLSLITTSARGVHSPTGIPGPSTFRPQRFARSRRFAPPQPCALVSSRCRVQGARSRGCPTLQPHHLVGDRYPRAVGAIACRFPGASERHVDLRVLLQTVVRDVVRTG